MKLEICTFEQAKALKELEFPQIGNAQYWYKDGNKIDHVHYNVLYNYFRMEGYKPDEEYCAPSLELIAKWLRDEKQLFLTVQIDLNTHWMAWNIINLSTDVEITEPICKHNSYEEALSTGIDKALEILKSKK